MHPSNVPYIYLKLLPPKFPHGSYEDYNIQFVLGLSQVDSRPIKWFEPSSIIVMLLSVFTPLTMGDPDVI